MTCNADLWMQSKMEVKKLKVAWTWTAWINSHWVWKVGRLRLDELKGNYMRSRMWLTLTEPNSRRASTLPTAWCATTSQVPLVKKVLPEGIHFTNFVVFPLKELISSLVFCSHCHKICPFGHSGVRHVSLMHGGKNRNQNANRIFSPNGRVETF